MTRFVIGTGLSVVLAATSALAEAPTKANAPAAATPAAAAAPPAAKAPAAAPVTATPVPITPENMQGVDWSGLSPQQKQLVFAIAQEQRCDCGCGMNLAECRVRDPKCPRSLPLVTQIVGLAKQGKGKDEIIKIALTPPWRFVQFDLAPGDSPVIGPASAPVTLYYYVDYQCPFCKKADPTVDQILSQYPRDVRVVFKMRPLAMHPNAMIASQAALAAQAQGKFLAMHKKLLENQADLSRDKLLALAKGLGLDLGKFTKDLDSEPIKARIAGENKGMDDIGATGTPALFVNGRFVGGAKSFEFFKGMIDEELAWAKAGNRPAFKTAKNVSETKPPKAADSGPDASKIYDIPVGKAAVVGPASAKVTILHYLDYQ